MKRLDTVGEPTVRRLEPMLGLPVSLFRDVELCQRGGMPLGMWLRLLGRLPRRVEPLLIQGDCLALAKTLLASAAECGESRLKLLPRGRDSKNRG
ncbi:hypothetical protein ACFWJY_04665 [Streptomyces anulatus]|uniref:hypothetical protein n=1 Tax=Streptomyces anulatus TaxID=1892 RepID=UPI00364601C8